MANDLQRTKEWFLQRKGKITASECYVLLNNSKVAMTEDELKAWKESNPKSRVTTKEVPFSTGTYSYLDEKIAEFYMPDNAYLEYLELCKYETKAMQWGTYWEEEARNHYSTEMGYDIVDAPFIPLKGYEKFAGGSPDGINKDENGIIEIKCPFNPATHLKYLLFEKPEDLLEEVEQYYVQCQYNMMCVELEKGTPITFCDFVSFDSRTTATKKLKVLRIPKDEEMQKKLMERTALAVEYIKQQMDKIDNVATIIK